MTASRSPDGEHQESGVWMRETVLAEPPPGAIVTTARFRCMMAVTCVNEGTDALATKDEDHAYARHRDGDLTDREMEAWHNETIARVRSGAIVLPRANRPSVYDLAALIRARAREMLRAMTPQEIEGYRQEDEPDVWAWMPLEEHVCERILDEFDVQDPDDHTEPIPDALFDLVNDAVGTWINEQEARAQGLPPPVMTAAEEELFRLQLIRDELEKRPEGTLAGEVMPIVDEKLERLKALRRRPETD